MKTTCLKKCFIKRENNQLREIFLELHPIKISHTQLNKICQNFYFFKKETFILLTRFILKQGTNQVKILKNGLLLPPISSPEFCLELPTLQIYSLLLPYLSENSPKLIVTKQQFLHLTPFDIFLEYLSFLIKSPDCFECSSFYPLKERKIFNLSQFIFKVEQFVFKYPYPLAKQKCEYTTFTLYNDYQNEHSQMMKQNSDIFFSYFLQAIQLLSPEITSQEKEEMTRKSENIIFDMYFYDDLEFLKKFDNDFFKKIENFEKQFNYEEYFEKVFINIKKQILNEKIADINEYLQYYNINNKKSNRDKLFSVLVNEIFSNKNIQKIKNIETKNMFDLKKSKRIKAAIEEHMKDLVKNIQQPYTQIIKEAQKQINKELKFVSSMMFGRQMQNVIKYFKYILIKYFNRSLDQILIDKNFVQYIQNHNQTLDGPIIFIPNHKSYFDFLIISFINVYFQYQPPFIAAGSNLNNIIGVSTIFKNSGAFFIQRIGLRFPKIYRAFLSEYIDHLLQNNINIEFFIEGTRSRTGKILPPRFGILKYIYESYLNKNIKNCTLIPISINYEYVQELNQILREWFGQLKLQENFISFLKSLWVLNHNFGDIQIKIANPIKFSEIDHKLGIEDTLNYLALKLTSQIQNNTILMNTCLISVIFLMNQHNIFIDSFLFQIDVLKNLINKLNGILSKNSENSLILKSISLFSFLFINKKENSIEFNLNKNLLSLFNILYFKNISFYLFAIEGIITLILFFYQRNEKEFVEKNFIQDCYEMSQIFIQESFNYENLSKEIFLQYLNEDKLKLYKQNEKIELKYQGNKDKIAVDIILSYFHPIIDSYCECYKMILDSINNEILEVNEQDYKFSVMKKLQEAYIKGMIESGESCSLNYITNCLIQLQSKNLIISKKTFDEKKKKIENILIFQKKDLNRYEELVNLFSLHHKNLKFMNFKLQINLQIQKVNLLK